MNIKSLAILIFPVSPIAYFIIIGIVAGIYDLLGLAGVFNLSAGDLLISVWLFVMKIYGVCIGIFIIPVLISISLWLKEIIVAKATKEGWEELISLCSVCLLVFVYFDELKSFFYTMPTWETAIILASAFYVWWLVNKLINLFSVGWEPLKFIINQKLIGKRV